MDRRTSVRGVAGACLASSPAWADTGKGQRLAAAARGQIGVTTGYDPTWTKLSYPGGDVPRSTGVCADVLIRAARDGLGLDLQRLVHEDMLRDFAAYPARRVWGSHEPDTNIDHRRVLNLEAYFTRVGARRWFAMKATAGDGFPGPLAAGNIVTWLLDARLPHIAIVGSSGSGGATVIHNIGRGVEESALSEFWPHQAIAHYRWPPN